MPFLFALRQIARQAGATKDPFFSSPTSPSSDDGKALTAPSRPFTMNSESIYSNDTFLQPSSPGRVTRLQTSCSSSLSPPFFPGRASSRSSISSIVDEHGSSSPLNKAALAFTDENGAVTQDFVQKLRALNSTNSAGDLCVEKCEFSPSLFCRIACMIFRS